MRTTYEYGRSRTLRYFQDALWDIRKWSIDVSEAICLDEQVIHTYQTSAPYGPFLILYNIQPTTNVAHGCTVC